MKVFSTTHAIAAPATAALVTPKGVNGKPLGPTLIVQHPAGTVLDLPDDEAEGLVFRKIVTEYKEDEHKAVDGVVPTAGVSQVVAPPLPEGFTHPIVTRQDESLNDDQTSTAPVVAAPVILRDTKDDAAKVAADKVAVAAAHPL